MTFKHKLSKRLAIIWDAAVLLSALALWACAGDQPTSTTHPHISGSIAAPTDPTILFQESFEDSAFATRGWYDNTTPMTTTAQHVPNSTRALAMQFSQGATTPVAGGAMRHLFTATPTVYVSYWVKYSSNWVGSGQPYHPHEFLIISDQDGDWEGPSHGWLVAYIEHNYQNGGIPRLALQDNKAINASLGALPIDLVNVTEDRSTSGCNGVVEANIVTTCFNMPPWYNDKELHASQVTFQPNTGAGYKGDWNHVEAYFEVNSIVNGKGVADGVMQYWFNGQLIIDRHDILFRTAARPTIQFNKFMMAPYIGDGSPVNQTMWVDDLIVATGRIESAEPPPSSGSVASVSVSPASASVAIGATQQFTATPKDSAGNNLSGRTVTWGSSDNAVATIAGSGLVTAIAAGTATIAATSGGVSGRATVTVTVNADTTPGTVTNLAVTGVTDSSVTLTFTEVNDGTGQPASYNVRWAVGTTITWGSAADVPRGSCATPVTGSVIGAKLSCTVLGLAAGTAYRFKLVAFRGTLNVDAVFGALSNGAGGTTAAAAAQPVASVAVSPASTALTVGATRQLAAVLKDTSGSTLTGRTVTWASSNSAVATVSASGLVTAAAAGSATITATAEGVTGTAAVSVTAIVTKPGTVTDLVVSAVTDTSVTLTFTEVTDGTGSPATYDLRFAAAPFSWGAATDVARGSCATPLAGTAIGARRRCTVLGLARSASYGFQLVAFRGTLNVDAVFGGLSNVASGTTAAPPAPVALVTLSPANASLLVGATRKLTAALKDAAGNPLSGRVVTWASSTPAVATVSASGLVTAVGVGNAAITATSEGVQDTASVAVTASTTEPATVTDLAVAGVSDSSVTLSFTEVNDGTGHSANYFVRFAVAPLAWGAGVDVGQGTCKVPMAGTTVGATRTCTVLGLVASKSYQFQLVAFRGMLDVDAVFGGLSNVASGTTATSMSPVASVTLSPTTTSLGVGTTQLFTATLKDAGGNTLSGRTVTWTSSNPLVATVGSPLVTAVAAGTATITATSEGKSGTASVTVTVLAPPPPPPPPGSWAHEPSGFTVVEDNGWESGVLGNWTLYNFAADKPITIANVTGSLLGESKALQIGYLAGHSGGGGTEARFEIPASYQRNEIFVGYNVQVNPQWQGHGSGINKMIFLSDGGAGGFSAMWYEMFGSGGSPLDMYVVNQSGGSPAGFHENVTPIEFTRGVWHKVEIYQKQGSPGIVRVWVDDVLVVDRADVYTNGAPVDAVALSGIWGGVGDAKAQFDYMRFDHIRISVR